MDFFTLQEEARRRTLIFLLLFPLAVLFLMVASIAVFWLGAVVTMQWMVLAALQPHHYALVAAFTLLVILLGSGYRMVTLAHGGGQRVALELGGRPVARNATQPLEQRLLNVVEEMAIAASLPVPEVYILDGQEGINAFAAGLHPGEAVIAVTTGALHQLTRDELQGVIGHEFSHILNGDMRLNLIMIGLLHGIQLFSLVGGRLAEEAFQTMGKTAAKGIHAIILGYLLWIAGYLGLVMARLIKGAVSRQREYLADASAVQFTRDNQGLAKALMKIGGFSMGSFVGHHRAEEASHLFFGEKGLGRHPVRDWGASHPPLEERIRRLWPAFQGEFPRLSGEQWFGLPEEKAAEAVPLTPAAPPQRMDGAMMAASVGAPTPAHLAHAAAFLAALPDRLRPLLQAPDGAAALICGMLLHGQPAVHRQQCYFIQTLLGEEVRCRAEQAEQVLALLGREWCLPLLDLAMPTLRAWPEARCSAFLKLTVALAQADQHISLFEYTLTRVLRHTLRPRGSGQTNPSLWLHSFRKRADECRLLLMVLARSGAPDEAAAEAAFLAGVAKLGETVAPLPPSRESCTLKALDLALQRLEQLSPNYKKLLIDGCCACITADGIVTVAEGELLRVVCVLLACPVPPLFPPRALP